MTQLNYKDIFKACNPYFVADTFFHYSEATNCHSHNFYEVFFMRKGSIIHMLNGREMEVGEGLFCFVKPSDEHKFQKTENSLFAQMSNIAFTPTIFNEVMLFLFGRVGAEINNSQPFHITNSLVLLFADLTDRLLVQQDKTDIKNSASIKGLLAMLIPEMLEKPEITTETVPLWLIKAKIAMEQAVNYEEGIHRFVELSGKSQEHLTRSMRKYYNDTPSGFVNRLRLQKAALLLRSTTKDITQIIFESGFGNVPHFNQLFKQQFGMQPRQYRRQSVQIVNPFN
ncbi:MAG: helix-turn-helix domain-containing protein [Prolixibacteraceae bacterium]